MLQQLESVSYEMTDALSMKNYLKVEVIAKFAECSLGIISRDCSATTADFARPSNLQVQTD